MKANASHKKLVQRLTKNHNTHKEIIIIQVTIQVTSTLALLDSQDCVLDQSSTSL